MEHCDGKGLGPLIKFAVSVLKLRFLTLIYKLLLLILGGLNLPLQICFVGMLHQWYTQSVLFT